MLTFRVVFMLFNKNYLMVGIFTGISLLPYLLSVMGSTTRLFKGVRLRYVLREILKASYHGIEYIFFTPFYAYEYTKLFFITIYQSWFSKKSLLCWKPFKSKEKKGFIAYAKLFFPSKIMMSILGVLSFDPFFIAFAGVYTLYAFVVYKGAEIKIKEDKDELAFIKDVALKTFSYFDKVRINGLFRDNLQLSPKCVQTNMTSPTDIGFALLAYVCGVRAGFITSKEADKRINETLAVVKKLKKYEGHLYNWYDVYTLEPMFPKSISTADSGNFFACLAVVREYAKKKGDLKMAETANELLNVGFDFLYDKDRDLLCISYYPDSKKNEGRYDILQSESRLSYLLAISKGVPFKSWFELSRPIISFGGNTELSWGGSLFEYLMPTLFIKPPLYSMQYRTEANAIKIHAKSDGDIWGVSESCYDEFDSSLRYKYKQHGLSTLAMSSDVLENVYSPYSAALALRYSKGEVGKTLREYLKVGAYGELGFCESVDGGKPLPIYMTHHQGMILVSIINKLYQDYVAEAFSNCPEVLAVRLLLAEPYIVRKDNVYNPSRSTNIEYVKPQIFINNNEVGGTILTNGVFSHFFTTDGKEKINLSSTCLYPIYDNPHRLNQRVVIINENGKEYKNVFENANYVLSGSLIEKRDGKFVESVKLLPEINGEVRRIRINADSDGIANVGFYSDISLCSLDETFSHKAFQDMFVKSRIEEGQVIFERKNNDFTPLVGFKVFGLEELEYNTNKLNVIKRNEGFVDINSVNNDEFIKEGDILYPCFSFNGVCNLTENTSLDIFLLTVFGESKRQVEEILSKYDHDALRYAFDVLEVAERSNVFVSNAQLDYCKEASDLFYKISNYGFSESYLKRRFDDDKYHVLFDKNTSKCTIKQAVNACTLLKFAGYDIVLHTKERVKDGINFQLSNDTNGVFYHVFGEEVKSISKINPVKTIRRKIDSSGLRSGEGYFEDGKYIVSPFNEHTLKPYSNILAGKKCGLVVTENGGGFSFMDNSRQKKISQWYNDEFDDTRSENVYAYINGKIYDLLDNAVCLHAQEYTEFRKTVEGVSFSVTLKVSGEKLLKQVKIVNKKQENTYLALAFGFWASLDWKPSRYVYAKEKDCGKLVLVNDITNLSCSFVLKDGIPFGGEENLLKGLKGQPFEFGTGYFGLYKYIDVNAQGVAVETLEYGKVGRREGKEKNDRNKLKINTGIPYLDILFNDQLYKQVYDCRFLAKTSFYQCGGGFGFRDQLQDCLAILYSNEKPVAEHLLKCFSRQYEEGDVMHWWHDPRTGVRTKNADDRFFLAFVLAKYIDKTGDIGFLNRKVPFIKSEPLSINERSRYEVPTLKRTSETIREHLKRAILSGIDFGKHDLLKVWGGDWNDGLDKVGAKGIGESVWLSMFAYMTIIKCIGYFEKEDKRYLNAVLQRLKHGINASFKSDRFIAYYTDDGEILGDRNSNFCNIYSLTQAFASISGAVDKNVVDVALDTALKLYDKEYDLVKIFDKPFVGEKYGYIGSYPKGVRENGGQYTHAAVWLAKALFDAERPDEGYEILRSLNPIELCATKTRTMIYRAEPYVLSADVYDGDFKGRAGWSWYTGSASWYYVTVLESMIGLKFESGAMYFKPNLPKCIDEVLLDYENNGVLYKIKVKKSNKEELTVNGKVFNGRYIKPTDECKKMDLIVEYIEEKDEYLVTLN